MLRILLVTNDFLPMIGGVAIHIDALATSLSRLGCEVTVLHVCYDTIQNDVQNSDEYDVIRLVAGVGLANKTGIYPKLMRYIKSLTIVRTKIKSLIKTFRPDVIHWHDYYHSSLSTKFLGKNNCALVLTNHASQFLEQYDKGVFMHLYLRFLASHANGVIAPSQELAAKSGLIRKPTQFIPNGVNECLFCPTKKYRKEVLRQFNIKPHFKVLLAPRRLDPKNGLDVLIRSIPLVIEKNPNVIFIIAGGGKRSLESEYRTLAETLGVAKHLIITGVVSHKKMQQLIPSADLILIPSFYEAVSLAALEALSCGVPVIASNVGGLPFIVNEHNGALFEPGNQDDLSKTINEHLDDWPATLKKGKIARKTIKSQHTWNTVAAKTIEFYNYLG